MPFPSLPVTLCSLFVYYPLNSLRLFSSLLMSFFFFFFFHIPSCSSLSILFAFPVVLTSCPRIEGVRRRGKKGMLILSPQWLEQKERLKKSERKCHSSEEMRWPLHCVRVSVCVSTEKIRVTVWVTFRVFLRCLVPLLSKWYMCVCARVFVRRGQMFIYVCSAYPHLSPFLPLLQPFSARFVFQVNHLCLSIFLHSRSLCSLLTHVANVIMFRGWTEAKPRSLVGGREGGQWGFGANVGRGRKSHWYVYPITTLASPKSPSQRMDARALKIATSILPSPFVARVHICVLVSGVMR